MGANNSGRRCITMYNTKYPAKDEKHLHTADPLHQVNENKFHRTEKPSEKTPNETCTVGSESDL